MGGEKMLASAVQSCGLIPTTNDDPNSRSSRVDRKHRSAAHDPTKDQHPVDLQHHTRRAGHSVQAVRNILEEREIRERIHPIVGFENTCAGVFSEFAAESL